MSDDGRDRFLAKYNVSRETTAQLDVYAALLHKWNPAINLVSNSTLKDIWSRHFCDSAQVLNLAPDTGGSWVDIGTGGGFPGMVVALLANASDIRWKFTFVESDRRKATFLRTVSRETRTPVTVAAERAETLAPQNADVLSARALAPLSTLLGYAQRHLKPKGRALFLKGESYQKEIDQALETWSFQSQKYISSTSEKAVVLSLGDIKRV